MDDEKWNQAHLGVRKSKPISKERLDIGKNINISKFNFLILLYIKETYLVILPDFSLLS